MVKHGPILLIDDDKDEWELMEYALRQINISNELVCFSNGKEALDYLKATPEQPFLIFSDINLPVMDGIELRKRINENEEVKRKSIPFIFLTTAAGAPTVKEVYEMSVQGFFEKPHTMQEVKRQLKEICDYWQRCRHPNSYPL